MPGGARHPRALDMADGAGAELPDLVELQARVAELEAEESALRAPLAGQAAELARAAAQLQAQAEALREAEAQAARKAGELAEAKRCLALHEALEATRQDPEWRDWAGGLPKEVLEKIAETLVAQTEAGWAARLKERPPLPFFTEEKIQEEMARRKRNGLGLFVFAMVCKPWRKAQLKVGGRLHTRVNSDVLLPGRVALVKWALAEGCPRDDGNGFTMAGAAASYGKRELVKWLCGEGGFAMDKWVVSNAAGSGNLKLVKWLRAEGCPWNYETCYHAVKRGRVEVLHWARENGCPWETGTRNRAAAELGYTDNFGNLEDYTWSGLL